MRSTIALTARAAGRGRGRAGPPCAADRGGVAHEVYREGFLIGFSLGAGDLGPDPCRDCGPGRRGRLPHRGHGQPGGRGHAGGKLRHARRRYPRPLRSGRPVLARSRRPLLAQGRDRRRLPRRRRLRSPADPFDDRGDNHVYPTLFGGAGVEVVRSGRFTIDLQLRGAATFQSGHRPQRLRERRAELVLTPS